MTTHPETQYLDAMRRAWEEGDERVDRTGVGTRALFGVTMRFDLSDGTIPLITTKKVAWKVAVKELIWFLSGDTNIRELVRQKVHIWTDWPMAKYVKATGEQIDRATFEQRVIDDDDFAAKWGDLGPVYGKQWVDWPHYTPVDGGLFRKEDKGVNQIADLVTMIRDNPTSRRLIFTGWNVPHLGEMALPPCHMTYQYQVANGRLHGILYQRSCDLGLGFPFNILEAALLIRMLAQQTGLEPGELVWMGADTHVYSNHGHLVEEQTSREPRAFPTFSFARKPESMFDYRLEDFVIDGYDPHPHISAPVAV
ncbi:thymidylate synthase [Sphingomonas montanisoli]|uniref:Thymidylate synthase n=1 Tax=Sphingomonas montanisoli TaxID=2606412 RepID=A0A5D9C2L2_9SPHN|nr:thymidylate synthase [Sphingomonas montanisoli]TZG26098.1 thymidylate synthase [Sphingomonas montanisoli]